MNLAYLLTGGNMGLRSESLRRARQAINSLCGKVLTHSQVFETAAWGIEEQPAFLNQALLLHTSLPPQELLEALLEIEKDMGRERAEKYGPRVIDIDILLYNQVIYNTGKLVLPHPQLANRRFALTCLNDLAPHVVHPVINLSVKELLVLCKDTLSVQNYSHTD